VGRLQPGKYIVEWKTFSNNYKNTAQSGQLFVFADNPTQFNIVGKEYSQEIDMTVRRVQWHDSISNSDNVYYWFLYIL
jgi:hypothetical protein